MEAIDPRIDRARASLPNDDVARWVIDVSIRAVAAFVGQAFGASVSMRMVSWSRVGAAFVPSRERGGDPPAGQLEVELWPLRDAGYVARLLGIPRKSVLQYAREGRLPCVRIGRHVRFVIADVQAAIDAQRPARRRG